MFHNWIFPALFDSWNDKSQLIDPDLVSVKMEYLQGLQVGNLKRIWVFMSVGSPKAHGSGDQPQNKTKGVCHTMALPFT